MDVAGDSGACTLPHIHADVETFRFVRLSQMPFGKTHQIHHFAGGFGFERRKGVGVSVRNDHEVPTRVWISVQNHEIVTIAVNHQILFVVCIARDAAKHATFRLMRRREVLIAPGAPEVIHFRMLRDDGCFRNGRGIAVGCRGVHNVLQFLAGFEVGNLLGGHFHARTGFWIAAYA